MQVTHVARVQNSSAADGGILDPGECSAFPRLRPQMRGEKSGLITLIGITYLSITCPLVICSQQGKMTLVVAVLLAALLVASAQAQGALKCQATLKGWAYLPAAVSGKAGVCGRNGCVPGVESRLSRGSLSAGHAAWRKDAQYSHVHAGIQIRYYRPFVASMLN